MKNPIRSRGGRIVSICALSAMLYGCSGGLSCGGQGGGCVNGYVYPQSGLPNGTNAVDNGARMRMTQAALDFLDLYLKDILLGALGSNLADPDTIALNVGTFNVAGDGGSIGQITVGQGSNETYPTTVLIDAATLSDNLNMQFVEAGDTVDIGGDMVTVTDDGILLDVVDLPVGIDARIFGRVSGFGFEANAGCDLDGTNPNYCPPGNPECGLFTGLNLGILVYPDVAVGADCDVQNVECLKINVDVVKADFLDLMGDQVSDYFDISTPPHDNQDCNSVNPPFNCSPECSDQNFAEAAVGLGADWECDVFCAVGEFSIDFVANIAGFIEPLLDSFLDDLLENAIANALDDFDGAPLAAASRFGLSDTVGPIAPGDTLDLGYSINPSGNAFDVNCPSGINCAQTKGMDLIMRSGFEAAPDDMGATPVPHPCVTPVEGQDFVALFGGTQFTTSSNIPLDGLYNGAPYHIGASIAEGMVRQALFGVYNSGVLCLEVSSDTVFNLTGGAFPLAAGTIDLLTEGKLRQFADPSAPAIITVTPYQPPVATMGAGTEDEGHLIFDWEQVEISFYVLSQERFARIFAVTADLTMGASVLKDPATDTLKLSIVQGPDVGNFTQTYNELLPNVSFVEVLESLVGLVFDAALGNGLEFELDFADALSGALGVPLYLDFHGIETLPASDPEYLNMYLSLTDTPPAMPEMRTAATPVRPALADTPGIYQERDDNPVALPTGEVRLSGTPFDLVPGTEYFVTIDFGMLRGPFVVDDEGVLTVRDARLRLLGRHTLYLRGRPPGLHDQLQPEADVVSFFVDPVPPKVRLRVTDGVLVAEATDVGSDPAGLRFAWGKDDEALGPFTGTDSMDLGWYEGARLARVQVQDEAGNLSRVATVDLDDLARSPRHDRAPWAVQRRVDLPERGGCASVPGLSLFGLAAFVSLLRRRKRL